MKTFSIHFKSITHSDALASYVRETLEQERLADSRAGLLSLQVHIAEENGPQTPGPDLFSCSIVAHLRGSKRLCIKHSAASAYAAVDLAHERLVRALSEVKRRKVAKRNDTRPRRDPIREVA